MFPRVLPLINVFTLQGGSKENVGKKWVNNSFIVKVFVMKIQ